MVPHWNQVPIIVGLAGQKPLAQKMPVSTVLPAGLAWIQMQIFASHAAHPSEEIPVRVGSSQSEMM